MERDVVRTPRGPDHGLSRPLRGFGTHACGPLAGGECTPRPGSVPRPGSALGPCSVTRQCLSLGDTFGQHAGEGRGVTAGDVRVHGIGEALLEGGGNELTVGD